MNNDKDNLYVVYYPFVGKRIVTKEVMIEILKEEIEAIENGTTWDVGRGLAFRNIQTIDTKHNNQPLGPNYNENDFFEALRWKESE